MAAHTTAPGPPPPRPQQPVGQTLEEQAIYQVEWYLGRQNLVKDYYLQGKMDSDYWVSLDIIIAFPKMKLIGFNDPAVVADLLARGSQTIEVDLATNRIRPAWAKRSILSISGVPRTANLADMHELMAKNPANPSPVSITPVPDRDGVWHAVYDSPDEARVALDSLKDATFGSPPVKLSADIFPALDQAQTYAPDFAMSGGMQGMVPPLGAPHVMPGGFYPSASTGTNGNMALHAPYPGGVVPSPMGSVPMGNPAGPQGGSGYAFVPSASYAPSSNGYNPTSPGFVQGGSQPFDPSNGQFYGSPYTPQGAFDASAQQQAMQNGGSASGAPQTPQMAKAAAAAAAAAMAGARSGNVNPGGFHQGSGHVPAVGTPVNSMRFVAGSGGVQGDVHPANGGRGRQTRQGQRHSYNGHHGNPQAGQFQNRHQGHNGTDGHGMPRGVHQYHGARPHSGSMSHGDFVGSGMGGKMHMGSGPAGRKMHAPNGYQNGGSGYVDGGMGVAGRGTKMGGTVGDVMGRPHVGSKKHKKRSNANRNAPQGGGPHNHNHHGSGSDGRSGQDSDGARDDGRRNGYDDAKKMNGDDRRGMRSEPNLTTMHFPPLPGSSNGSVRQKSPTGDGSCPVEAKESGVGATHDAAPGISGGKTAVDVVNAGLAKTTIHVSAPAPVTVKTPQSPASSGALDDKPSRAEPVPKENGGSTAESEQDLRSNGDDAIENDDALGNNSNIEKLACVSDVSSNVSSSSGCAPNAASANATSPSNGQVPPPAIEEKSPPDVGATSAIGSGMSYAAILRATVKKPAAAPVAPSNVASNSVDANGQGSAAVAANGKASSSDAQNATAVESGKVSPGAPSSASASAAKRDADSPKDAKKVSSTGTQSGASVMPAARSVWANKPQSVLQATAVVRPVTPKATVTAPTPSPTVIQNPVLSSDAVAPSAHTLSGASTTPRVASPSVPVSSGTLVSSDAVEVKDSGVPALRADKGPATGLAQMNGVDSLAKTPAGDLVKKGSAVEKAGITAKGAWGQSPRIWAKEVTPSDKVGTKNSPSSTSA